MNVHRRVLSALLLFVAAATAMYILAICRFYFIVREMWDELSVEMIDFEVRYEVLSLSKHCRRVDLAKMSLN